MKRFDFGDANADQKKAITTTDGPVLITAGPGTGKTYTLVQRTIYLIKQCGVKPESIFIATFTEKAAKELITRITNELSKNEIEVNINEMYIGTFHSLCLRILKDHLEYTRLRKNYRLLDDFDQKYMVFQNIWKFRNVKDFDTVIKPQRGGWANAEEICKYVNNLSEEMVSPKDLIKDKAPAVAAMGRILETYQGILEEENMLDFSSIQTEAYRLLTEHKGVLKKLQSQITHVMVDEYQDTNYIQEQLAFLLAGKRKNICVVGDDDQGLYRFRGATIRNILEFPQKFPKGECRTIKLALNYRSNSDIVDFYNEWMATTSGANFKFSWGNCRHDKTIKPYEKTKLRSPAVVKLSSKNDEDEWHEKILDFIKRLKASRKLKDYNQIAFLFNSVKKDQATDLANFLEENGINVYSPRSAMFFQREEVRLVLGCLMLMFPNYVKGLQKGAYDKYLKRENKIYYKGCIELANALLEKPKNKDLCTWIRQYGRKHAALTGTTDYAYCALMYQLFEFQPFSGILDTELNRGVVDVRPVRNIAKLTQIIAKYEYLNQVEVLSGKEYKEQRKIDWDTERLFNLYLRLLFDGGITEYEDDSEYAPSGCVSFLTIHQAKGMEFPIVLVDSLWNVPRKRLNDLMISIEKKYFHRKPFEPYNDMKYFDFWRLYYTAFSRAQDLLVLTCNETTGRSKTPSSYFEGPYMQLPSAEDKGFKIKEFSFKPIKDVNLKNSYSFTSHIIVYETCARQYKFYKELEFQPIRAGALLFGVLVHETIEDVHRAALRHEESSITNENVTRWFNSNYISLSKTEHTYLAPPQREAALQQVLRYVENVKKQPWGWSRIQQTEVDISLVKPDYIIKGKIDLIRGEEEGSVEIVDFKATKKPDLEAQKELLERYRRQLHIYAHLVEGRTGQKVSRMHLYYTGEENGVPAVTFPYKKTAVAGTLAAFDDTVHLIMAKDFNSCTEDRNVCENCDFRYYCKNK